MLRIGIYGLRRFACLAASRGARARFVEARASRSAAIGKRNGERKKDMSTYDRLPVGVRLNNPGCLRHHTSPGSETKLVEGYCQFRTWDEGCINLAWCIWNFYSHLELKTPKLFISRYAPPSENDTLQYIKFVSTWLMPTKKDAENEDMHLDEGSNAALMMQAIATMECGWQSTIGATRKPWITSSEAFMALAVVGKFR